MNWFSKLFNSGVTDVITSVGDVFDKLHTSEDERLEAKAKLAVIMNDFALKQEENANKFESEVTARHQADMLSDSWLSKNIRPMVLLVTMVTIYFLVYLTVFTELKEQQITVLNAWIPMVSGLFGTMVIFYFGSRGIEKVNSKK